MQLRSSEWKMFSERLGLFALDSISSSSFGCCTGRVHLLRFRLGKLITPHRLITSIIAALSTDDMDDYGRAQWSWSKSASARQPRHFFVIPLLEKNSSIVWYFYCVQNSIEKAWHNATALSANSLRVLVLGSLSNPAMLAMAWTAYSCIMLWHNRRRSSLFPSIGPLMLMGEAVAPL